MPFTALASTTSYARADDRPRSIGSHRSIASTLEAKRRVFTVPASTTSPHPSTVPKLSGASESTWYEDLDGSRFMFRQRVSAVSAGLLQDVDLQLRWQDRFGMWQTLRWPARMGRSDPAVVLLALNPLTVGDVALMQGRHAAVAEGTRELSPGWLVFKPVAGLAEGWLLDARTGSVAGLCELDGRSVDELTAADVADCRARMTSGSALLLSGEVHFDLSASPSSAAPISSAMPLSLVLRLRDASASPAPPHCISNAISAAARGWTVVSYRCLVYPRSSDQRWSGRSELDGPAADLKRYRICRYSADHNHDGHIDNAEHPASYADVEGPLTQQNFLVIQAGLPCPTGLPADPVAGRLLSMNTEPHQPPD